jgi:hypothetical protein
MKLRPPLCLAALALASCQPASPPPRTAVRDVPRADVTARTDASVPADALSPAALEARLAPEDRLRPYGSSQALVAHLRLRTQRFGQAAQGALLGGTIGDAFGSGGLGASGSGQGGGGTGEGTIGLGSLGTIGHGAGTGTGQGYGSGAGRGLRGARAASAPGGAPAHRVGGEDSITNNQVEGVDEGDIVKAHGDHLIILRRGRLLSVRLGGDALTPVSKVNAWGEGRPAGGWYDEMLVDGDTVVVIGYSYRAQATEVGLFDLSAEGVLRWRDTMFVRSSDYYSSRNYASRLVGHHLVMYMPVPLRMDERDTLHLPAVRHGADAAWSTVIGFDHLYRPLLPLGYDPVIHTVMSCDLSGRGFDCRAVGAVGPGSRNFYVSGGAVYLWVGGEQEPWVAHDDRRRQGPQPAVLYRFPLDCGAPGAARVRGAPIDQFSFDEHGEAVRVLLAASGRGEAMWGAAAAQGDVGLVSVPLAQLTAEVPTVAGSAYKGLGHVSGGAGEMHNRFVGDHVLFGAGEGWRRRAAGAPREPLFVHHVPTGVTTQLAVPHSVERIEPIGRDALAVGNEGGNLTFSAVALDATPSLAGRHTVRGASQGDSRSHGFFYAPSGDRAGVMGLPISRGGEGSAWSDLGNASSAVMFLSVRALNFRDMGSLRSGARGVNDRCVASCADWYGNARPIFWQGRTFALLGYELVEGSVAAERIRERRRVDVFRALEGAAGDGGADNAFDAVTD